MSHYRWLTVTACQLDSGPGVNGGSDQEDGLTIRGEEWPTGGLDQPIRGEDWPTGGLDQAIRGEDWPIGGLDQPIRAKTSHQDAETSYQDLSAKEKVSILGAENIQMRHKR